MADDFRYAPRGFTEAPAVRAILEKRFVAWELDPEKFVRFEGLSALEAERLLALLPPAQAEDAQNYAPTFAQFVALGERCPGMTLSGYRVGPERDDERVSIEAIEIPEEEATPEVLNFVRSFGPDEDRWIEYGRPPRTRVSWRAWWD